MKPALLLVVLTLATSVSFAGTIDFTNQFGTITVTNAGITTRGSELMTFDGIPAAKNHSLGTVDFSTGALATGSIFTGGTFSSAGSSFDIFGNGQHGLPKGIMFAGSFIGPIDWTMLSHTGQFDYTFALSGKIDGMLANGRMATGTTVQYITLYKNQWFHDNKGSINLGNTGLSTPEPSALMLMGTGVLGIAGMFRRRFTRA
jgi:hypothetical protein